jgi:hypothetical protein
MTDPSSGEEANGTYFSTANTPNASRSGGFDHDRLV